MPVIKREAFIPYTAVEMYDLVDAVERYPEFVPACKSANILSRDEDEVHATLNFASGAISKSFTTRNRLQKHKMIEIKLVNGPFKHLEGFWLFEHEGETHCKIILDLEFEFSNKLLSLIFGPVFHQVTSTLVDVFVKRAQKIYGDRNGNPNGNHS